MKLGQKFPLRDKQLRELQKQAWMGHEEERKRKYMEFLQKKKQGNEIGRYNEAISAKTKLQKEQELAQAAAKQQKHIKSAEPKRAIPTDKSEPQQQNQQRKLSAADPHEQAAPAFSGDFVTLTKEQLKLLLDAAEHTKNQKGDSAYGNKLTNTNITNSKYTNDYKIAGDHKRDSSGDTRFITVTAVEPEHIPGLAPQNNQTEFHSQPATISLGERKRQQWAEEKEELTEYLKEAAAAAVRKAISKNEIPLTGESSTAAVVSHILSESLREKKLRQWEVDNRHAQEAKGSLAEIGQRVEERRPRKLESPQPLPQPKNEPKKQSLVEKKKKQWEVEKGVSKEGSVMGEWFGKPGAGAPIRSEAGEILVQYGARADEAKSVQDTLAKTYSLNIAAKTQQNNAPFDFSSLISGVAKESARNVVISEPGKNTDGVPPAAMRSAFAAGGAAPDERRFDDVKQRERQSWLNDLKRQIEEKQAQKAREQQLLDAYYRDEPAPLSYPQENVSQPSGKQIIQVEYDKKRPAESEAKYASFMPGSQEGIEREMARITRRQKEAVDNASRLHQALAQAELEAQKAKLLRRIEKLRAGGHDTRGLEKTYKELLTPRGHNAAPAEYRSTAIPGLNEVEVDVPLGVQHQATRILTPTERRNNRNVAPVINSEHNEQNGQQSTGRESCAIQTEDFVFASGKRLRDILREQSKVEIEYRESNMEKRHGGPGRDEKKRQQQVQQKQVVKMKEPQRRPVDEKRTDEKSRKGEKKPWQYQNTKNLHAVKASDREVAVGSAERNERERKRKERALQMIAIADANMSRSRLLPGDGQRGRLVPVDEQQLRRPRSRSVQRLTIPQGEVRKQQQRHVSPPPDLPSARFQPHQAQMGRGMPLPPQRQNQKQSGEAEYLPFRRTSGGLDRSELPANYDVMVDTSGSNANGGAEKSELMRQHLQFLKQGLLRRQQELERSMTPNTLNEVRASQQYRNT